MADDEFDAAWDRAMDPDSEPTDGDTDEAAGEDPLAAEPPIRVTVVVRADSVPIAPWPQGWRVLVAGPMSGHVTLLFDHEIDVSPVAQLAAVTGLLAILKGARLEIAWWAIQARGPLPSDESDQPDLDQELADLLGDDLPPPPEQ
jgi:hypothetical protein